MFPVANYCFRSDVKKKKTFRKIDSETPKRETVVRERQLFLTRAHRNGMYTQVQGLRYCVCP